MASVILLDQDSNEVEVSTAWQLVALVYGRGYRVKTGSFANALDILNDDGDPSADENALLVLLGDLRNPSSMAIAAIQDALSGGGSHSHPEYVDDAELAAALATKADSSALAALAPLASPTFTGTVSGVTKTHVGLANVDNTADTAKPVSTAQQTALNAKANTSHTHVATTDLTATGTKDTTTFLRGDNTWAVPSGGGGGWTAVDATETVKGIAEIATAAEVSTGTDDARIVTPLKLKTVADAKVASTDARVTADQAAGTASIRTIGTGALQAKAGNYQPTAANISDSTTVGRAVLTAADAAAGRTAIGAGTSSLAIGTTSTTAKAGDYAPNAAAISDSTTVGRSVLTAASAAAGRTAIGAGVVDSSDATILNVVKLTQAAYDGIGSKVATTLYVIVG